MSKAVLGWLAVLFVFSGLMLAYAGWRYSQPGLRMGGGHVEVDREYQRQPASASEPWLSQFELTERSGKKHGTAELAGQPYVVNFFFSTCPTVCRTQTQKVKEVAQEFGPQGVMFLSITCDPDTDTPARLRDYAHQFDADPKTWWFLTGDLVYIRRIAAEMFGVALDRQTHTEKLLVVDKWGEVRGRYHWAKLEEVAALRSQLKELLAETEPPAKPAEPSPAPAAADPTDPSEPAPAANDTPAASAPAEPASSSASRD